MTTYRTVYTVTEKANRKAANAAAKADLVAELRAALPSLMPGPRSDAELVLAHIDTWSAMELAPMVRKIKALSDHQRANAERLAGMTREQIASEHERLNVLLNGPVVDVRA